MRSASTVSGKFLQVAGGRFLIRGVSYGTFAPGTDGAQFPLQDCVARDFKAIKELGANTVRTYTPPSVSVLDEAARCGLRVIVGLPWPQHVAFLDNGPIARDIRKTVRDQVERLASHPATLLFTVGNEIPPGVVRWYGRKRIEQFLRELFEEAKAAASDSLVTYINYPPTEYLDISFFDICGFNLFLHTEAELAAYLARLQHIAGSRPLLIAEAGADSLRNGERHQAALVEMQLRTAFGEGAAGAIVFSWTDEWWRSGRSVDDWRFGLVDSSRRRKPAYEAVQRVFQSAPFPADRHAAWPRVSVVVCAYNAADTIDECLIAIEQLRYPNFEIIVVNDGSTDALASIVERHPQARLINTANAGLSAARNVGFAHATGAIIAYTDADTCVDPDWLAYLIQPFLNSHVVAVGGPNIVPPDDPWVAQCVARAPGCPTHVLLDDRLAEHIPGCNSAFRRDALAAINGFNPIFVRAGDDVDVCWRLQARGWNIGFAPSALVWHRHRSSVRAYLRQQIGYGEGETWLTYEHPEKFIGDRIAWRGHLYSPLPFIRSLSETRINTGPLGSAAFPSVYRADAHPFAYITHCGAWQIAWVMLLIAAIITSASGKPQSLVLFVLASFALAATLSRCLLYGLRSDLGGLPSIGRLPRTASRVLYRLTIATLHFLQPFARLYGRLRGIVSRPAIGRRPEQPAGTVARGTFAQGARLLCRREAEVTFWSENWIDVRTLLSAIADRLRRQRAVRSIELDSGWWEDRDLTIVNRLGFRLDVRALVEDHGGGQCLCRLRMRPRVTLAVLPLAAATAMVMFLHGAGIVPWPVGAGVTGLLAAGMIAADVMVTSGIFSNAVDSVKTEFGMLSIASRKQSRHAAGSPAGIFAGAGGEYRAGRSAAISTLVPPDQLAAAQATDKARASPSLGGSM